MFYEILRIAAFTIGSIFLGVALVMNLFFRIARRHHPLERGEGCLGNFICLSAFSIAGIFFFLAVSTPL